MSGVRCYFQPGCPPACGGFRGEGGPSSGEAGQSGPTDRSFSAVGRSPVRRPVQAFPRHASRIAKSKVGSQARGAWHDRPLNTRGVHARQDPGVHLRPIFRPLKGIGQRGSGARAEVRRAMQALTLQAARQFVQDGTNCLPICPGWSRTEAVLQDGAKAGADPIRRYWTPPF
jgi:NAD(P)-dependent dehydrogenase (short-subunit alcohol dehydrogenase family)